MTWLSGAGEFLDENFGFNYPPAASVNDCASGNQFSGATYPPAIEGTWGCDHKTTPNPGGGAAGVFYLLGLIEEGQRIRAEHPPVGQAAPPPQETKPDACAGVPTNPLCP